MDRAAMDKILTFQKNEITEHFIYRKLSKFSKGKNQEVLQRIAEEELKHSNIWKKYSNTDVKPDGFKIWKYILISRVLGLTFGIKLMERGEKSAQAVYEDIVPFVPDAKQIISEENAHEKELIEMIDEERLRYVGSIVLGLNDALVELTGTLAGLTLALQNTRLVATAGLITGIAASLSMSASEYLSTKSEESARSPVKASVYTGLAYIVTVFFLVLPFLMIDRLFVCLGFSVISAIVIIFLFTFYVSVAKDICFKKRFSEMAGVSLGVAALSFLIGLGVRYFLKIEL